jgi:hypothetical protein
MLYPARPVTDGCGRTPAVTVRAHAMTMPGSAAILQPVEVTPKGLQSQIDDLVEQVTTHQLDIAKLKEDAAIDRVMIAELQAEGLVSQKHAAELERALMSSRTIGTAIGILMANRGIGQAEAFAVLQAASQRSNRKLRELATDLVETTERGERL